MGLSISSFKKKLLSYDRFVLKSAADVFLLNHCLEMKSSKVLSL